MTELCLDHKKGARYLCYPPESVFWPVGELLLTPKKTEHHIEIIKIVNVFKKIWTIVILMRKDVPNPEKLVWGPYD